MTKLQVVIGFALIMAVPTIGVVNEPSAATIGVWFVFCAMLTIVAVIAITLTE